MPIKVAKTLPRGKPRDHLRTRHRPHAPALRGRPGPATTAANNTAGNPAQALARDPAQERPTRFAAGIAADRVAGRLLPGQEITSVYLKDLDHRYEQAGTPSPVAGYLDRAVTYLARTGARRIDVTA